MPYTPPPATAVTLNFSGSYTPPAATAVTLNFSDHVGGTNDRALTLSATLENDSALFVADARTQHLFSLAATLADSSATLGADYDSNVWRGITQTSGLPWDKTPDVSPITLGGWNESTRVQPSLSDGWQEGSRLDASSGDAWIKIPSQSAAPALAWDAAQRISAHARDGFGLLDILNSSWIQPWDAITRQDHETAQPYSHPPRKHAAKLIPWGEMANFSIEWGLHNHTPDTFNIQRRIPWEDGQPPPWVVAVYVPPYVPPEPTGCYTPPAATAVWLNLSAPMPGSASLNFTCHAAAAATSARVYIVSNTISIVRLPDRTPIPAHSVSLQIDVDSWAWGMSATLADRASLALVEPGASGPVEIEISLNGHIWVAMVEGYSESREFANSGVQISGRSLSAWLAAPYAPARSRLESSPYTANQLADSELFNTGFNLTWDAPDWQVPGGVFSYDSKTAMEAIATVASAAGYVIQPAMASKTLTIQPRYPSSPWDWATATPAATVPESMIFRSSLRWEPKPDYNAVWVAGQSQGVMVNVKRIGSAGDLAAPMVVDPLITDVPAGREHGRNLLSDTGKQATISIEIPLFATAPGLLTPGKLVEVQTTAGNWRGQVMGVSVEAAWNETLDITQSVEIERHY